MAQILGISEPELRRRLKAIDWQTQYEPIWFVARTLLQGAEPPAPKEIHWFHASRVLDPDSFRREGILPKATMQPRLREQLKSLATGLVSAGEYPNSMSVVGKSWINDEGPYAFMIRSVALHAPGATHDYTKAPESVEDIAGDMLGGNYSELVRRFEATARPCLIKFRAPGDSDHVRYALYYVYLVETGTDEISAADAANICYAGHGTPVPPEDILDVECL